MVQAIIELVIVGLLTGLVGIIWMIVRDNFNDDHAPDDNRHAAGLSPNHHDGEESYDRTDRQVHADRGVLAVHRKC